MELIILLFNRMGYMYFVEFYAGDRKYSTATVTSSQLSGTAELPPHTTAQRTTVTHTRCEPRCPVHASKASAQSRRRHGAALARLRRVRAALVGEIGVRERHDADDVAEPP